MDNIRISFEPIRTFQIPWLAAFHAKYLGGQLTQLGLAYIQYFYETAIEMKGTFGLAALENNTIGGFVFGSTIQNDLQARIIRKNPVRWAAESVKTLIGHPLKSTRVAWSVISGVSADLQLDKPELHFIAVRPDLRGRGIGQRLLEDFRKDVAARGKSHFGLSVPLNNPQAIRFYKSNGGAVLGDYKSAGVRMRRFLFKVRES